MPLTFPAINRRNFLSGTLAAGLFAVLPKSVLANESGASSNADHWVFLSDTHVPANIETLSPPREKDANGNSYNPNKNFTDVRDEVLKLTDKPKGVIITGDLAHWQGYTEDYQRIASHIVPYSEAGIPVHVAFGNHDNLNNFFEAFTQLKKENSPVLNRNVLVLESPNCNLFLLDSLFQEDASAGGYFGLAQRNWLAKELDARKEKPAILFAHHNTENGGIMDIASFWNIINPRKQVKAYVHGHTHVYQQSVRDNVHLINLPALGWESWKGVQPLGWSDALVSKSGIKLTLHTLDKKHPKNNDVRSFDWLR